MACSVGREGSVAPLWWIHQPSSIGGSMIASTRPTSGFRRRCPRDARKKRGWEKRTRKQKGKAGVSGHTQAAGGQRPWTGRGAGERCVGFVGTRHARRESCFVAVARTLRHGRTSLLRYPLCNRDHRLWWLLVSSSSVRLRRPCSADRRDAERRAWDQGIYWWGCYGDNRRWVEHIAVGPSRPPPPTTKTLESVVSHHVSTRPCSAGTARRRGRAHRRWRLAHRTQCGFARSAAAHRMLLADSSSGAVH